MKLLALDTASARCSVALLVEGELIARAVDTARDHASLILPMIEAVLADAQLGLRALDGIAFGRGPGSFTGVRVAASVTQGLAAGADLPVYGVSDLRALAAAAQAVAGATATGQLLLAAMDARMGEVYWGAFDAAAELPGDALVGEAVGAAAGLPGALGGRVVAAAGRGMSAYPVLAQSLHLAPHSVLGEAEPDAGFIARLAALDLRQGRSWQDAALAQPVYLRDQVVHASR